MDQHTDHGGHDMPMPGDSTPVQRCAMNMLWNTQIEDTCIVFRSWHISTTHAFIFSCLAIVALGVLYEWLREAQKISDARIAATLSAQNKGKARGGMVSGRSSPEIEGEEAGLLTGIRATKEHNGIPVPTGMRLSRAALYGAQVFLSFFLMLVFMTYNAYLILATVVGAALGHYIFNALMDVDAVLAGSSGAGKGMACH
ncbi:Ctr copper transporter [Phanerochaete sordida]|uniref:Copper transport protein n=1 Tax=Phanerochaete sordida TaxID=48140 RepID=A0A9P3LML1_9APHY|nr:Ctr copper transporter [Phanerochaete sordida]